jgi:hypothetical protein
VAAGYINSRGGLYFSEKNKAVTFTGKLVGMYYFIFL